ncbi:MAG: hypothetical protein M3003_06580 [Candidatus Dormibacteraeota bacterium]|nr:hypothetical protein [Candidatus Dormibacteraeota bacterium]
MNAIRATRAAEPFCPLRLPLSIVHIVAGNTTDAESQDVEALQNVVATYRDHGMSGVGW